jgi:hypothetical protein
LRAIERKTIAILKELPFNQISIILDLTKLILGLLLPHTETLIGLNDWLKIINLYNRLK